jgi:hypothetical protein
MGNFLVIVRTRPHKDDGHFDPWINFCQEAEQYLNEFDIKVIFKHVFNEDEISTLYRTITLLKYENPDAKVIIHLEWLHDVYNFTSWEIFGSLENVRISSHLALTKLMMPEMQDLETRRMWQLINSSKSLDYLWTWDQRYAGQVLNKSRVISVPDFQPINLGVNFCELCDLKVPMFGLVGQIYGYRGADLIISLAKNFPDYQFVLVGKFHPNSISKGALRDLKKLKNLKLIDGYIPNDEIMNHYIMHLAGLVIDAARYPDPSGVSTRALAFGVKLLIPKSKSHLEYMAKFDRRIWVLGKNDWSAALRLCHSNLATGLTLQQSADVQARLSQVFASSVKEMYVQ